MYIGATLLHRETWLNAARAVLIFLGARSSGEQQETGDLELYGGGLFVQSWRVYTFFCTTERESLFLFLAEFVETKRTAPESIMPFLFILRGHFFVCCCVLYPTSA